MIPDLRTLPLDALAALVARLERNVFDLQQAKTETGKRIALEYQHRLQDARAELANRTRELKRQN